MYTPSVNKNEDREELRSFIRQHNFGILVSEVGNRPWATHIPFMLTADGARLTAHISRGNRQWKEIHPEKEALVIFHGPNAYISSSWYNHENVPTWNYIAVHVYGKLRIIEGDELKDSLRQLVNYHERYSEKPVSVDTMSPSFLESEIRGIVGFEIVISELQASYKLSQNRDAENHRAVVTQLQKLDDPGSREIAMHMRKRGPEQKS